MDPGSSLRILVAQPALRPGSIDLATVPALQRLGEGVRVSVVADADSCLASVRDVEPDLVVVDHDLGRDAHAILGQLREAGPPVVMVSADAREEDVVEAFRRGAADCVAASADYQELLPVVALEQIRRWRSTQERAERERRIADLERFNAQVIQNMNSALLVVDLEERITFANAIARRLFGPALDPSRANPLSELFPDHAPEQMLVARTLREGLRFRGAETVAIGREDRRIPVAVSCAPLTDAEGRRVGAVALLQDLTEMKQLQRQVLQTEKMASIGQLAAGVAHEINNPMGFIHANLAQMSEYLDDLRRVWSQVEVLRKAAAAGEPEALGAALSAFDEVVEGVEADFVLSDLAQAIRESQEGSERIRHIIQDLRAFSHHDPAEKVPADVNECLDSTANIVWTMMKHSAVLKKDYRELPPIECYPMQLKQVFMNLIVNAYQAIEAKPDAGAEPREIHLETRLCPEGVIVRVRDTGIGIDRAQLERIFDPFFTTKDVGVGTGLGLSTSYSIVRRHGGRIRVESEPGVGSTFEVLLPVRVGPAGAITNLDA